MSQSGRSSSGISGQQGFTLLEMVIVLTIISMVSLIGLSRFQKNQSANSMIYSVAAIVAHARQRAIETGRTASLTINLPERTLVSNIGKYELTFEKGAIIEIDTAVKLATQDTAQIVFNPDGSSTGGSISITDVALRTRRLKIDWLTGVAVIQDLDK